MLSNFTSDLVENHSLKRKSPECPNQTTPLPPNKFQRLEGQSTLNQEDCAQDFNTYQYWKDPLPDISFELIEGKSSTTYSGPK